MDKLRQWIALTVVGALVLGAAGYFLLIAPKRTEATDLRDQADSQVTANAGLRTQISVLKAQAKALPAKQAQLAAVAAKIPDNPSLPALIRALTVAADEANVELVALAPSTPTVVEAPVAAAAQPGAAVSAAPVVSSSAAPAAGAGAGAGAAAPSTAAAGVLQQITVSLTVVGGYFQVEQFLDQLESLTRAMKVKSLGLAPGTNPVKLPGATDAVESPEKTLLASIAATVYMATGRSTLAPVPTPTPGK